MVPPRTPSALARTPAWSVVWSRDSNGPAKPGLTPTIGSFSRRGEACLARLSGDQAERAPTGAAAGHAGPRRREPSVAAQAPVHPGREEVGADSPSVVLDEPDHAVDEGVGQLVGHQTQVQQLLVLGVVVVPLFFRARAGDVLDLGLEAVGQARVANLLRQLPDAELLGELIEHPVLACRRWIERRQLDAADRVANGQEAARLAPLAVHGQGVADRGLATEAIQYRAPDVVVVEARAQVAVDRGLRGLRAVDHTLVQVGGGEAPGPAGEHDVVAGGDLREVVEGAGRLG